MPLKVKVSCTELKLEKDDMNDFYKNAIFQIQYNSMKKKRKKKET
jgi:hypothetical protein